MKATIEVESVTDEGGTDHRVRALINGLSLTSDWTTNERVAQSCALDLRKALHLRPDSTTPSKPHLIYEDGMPS